MMVRLSALRDGRPLPLRKITGTHFCWSMSRPQGHSAAGRIRSIEKFNDTIVNRSSDITAYNSASINYATACYPNFKVLTLILLHWCEKY
jgi:hypothetical protein